MPSTFENSYDGAWVTSVQMLNLMARRKYTQHGREAVSKEKHYNPLYKLENEERGKVLSNR